MTDDRPYRDLTDDELDAWRNDIVYGMAWALEHGGYPLSDARHRILALILAELRARGRGVV